jgi:hypothetical protein
VAYRPPCSGSPSIIRLGSHGSCINRMELKH